MTLRDGEMDARQELLQRAEIIESGELRWVPRMPESGECCLISGVPKGYRHRQHDAFSDTTADRIIERYIEAPVISYNDNYIRNAAEAALTLRIVAGLHALDAPVSEYARRRIQSR